ncbi:MAG: YqgE/AlgH family protein [Gemmatimonadota bacterium]
MESLRGHVLISSAGLYDANFRHTVVLLAAHDAEGAVGVVLNRPLNATVREAVPPLAGLVDATAPLFQGGPVEPESPVLLAELAHPELADVLAFGAVGFLVGQVSADLAPAILRARVYAGYSGWGAGQLEAELEQDAWIVDPARADDVFTDDPELLWSRILARKGPEFQQMARVPFDPSMN